MALTTAGVVLKDMAYFIPVTYIPSYYIARRQLSSEPTLTGTASFAYHLLAICNGSSCVGRVLAGYISHRLERYNTMIISLFLCAVSGFLLLIARHTQSQRVEHGAFDNLCNVV